MMLANVASIYDPLGLLEPVIVQCKLFIQTLWQRQLDWDSRLPSELATHWEEIHQRLPDLNRISIPRRITAVGTSITVELHGFANASERAYGVCVYLCSVSPNGTITLHLLSLNSRVAPLKQVSLPRLELNAALLLSQLVDKMHRTLNLQIVQRFYWTDSTYVLAWIAGCLSTWKTYVANRVAEIQRLTAYRAWRHVASQDNPAGVISRGTDPRRLQGSQLCWVGPSWPAQPPADPEKVPKRRGVKLCCITVYSEIESLFERFSSWAKLQRVFAYVLRFLYKLKQGAASGRHGPLTSTKLHKLLIVIARITQYSSFAQEIQSLQQGKALPSHSKLLMLHPFLDGNNLLRVGGRLENADIPFDQKHPLILPSKHHVTKLLMWNEHIRLLHAGSQLLLASLQLRFWITNGHSVVSK
ncbi:uncharacterized protein LOC111872965 [Cryptotermes secundus]|uniref:uncharacterized protein LOC111872965 n=1 Tax=Cryptotermes secundus TaxID=105785 RepID=UPI001454DABE|nr:uncharacterized protein LOC111872965 [Cryptotermes secundus]XP_033610791.1 uncharacterized protein LOC111872965 [Cryptotermes secundus]